MAFESTKTPRPLYKMQESLFADRVRDYLNYKGLNYQEKALAVYHMLRRIPKKWVLPYRLFKPTG